MARPPEPERCNWCGASLVNGRCPTLTWFFAAMSRDLSREAPLAPPAHTRR